MLYVDFVLDCNMPVDWLIDAAHNHGAPWAIGAAPALCQFWMHALLQL